MIFGHLRLSILAFWRLSGQIDVYLRSHVPERVSPVNCGFSKYFLRTGLVITTDKGNNNQSRRTTLGATDEILCIQTP